MKAAVGFTNDGKVFFQIGINGPGGQPAKLTLTWTPQETVDIAKHLLKAADDCRSKTKAPSLIIRPGEA